MASGDSTPASSRRVGRGRRLQVEFTEPGLIDEGVADEKRHADGGLENQALVVKSVLPEPISLVGGVDHDRVLGQLFLIQIIKDSLQVVVIAGHIRRALDHVLVSDANLSLSLFGSCSHIRLGALSLK